MGISISRDTGRADGAGEPPRAARALPRVVLACGATCVAAGALALVGWATGLPVLKGLRAEYIPMAPNTALAFLALGVALGAVEMGWRRAATGLALMVGAVAAIRLVEYASLMEPAVDRLIVRVPSGRFGLAPLGRMSLFTAIGFLAASAAMGAIISGRRRVGDLGGLAALVAGAAGLVFVLGYLFSPDAPLMYGTQSIPMALNTAIAFVILAAGLVAALGEAHFPLRPLSGSTTRARLLRVFLPLVTATVGLVAWLTHFVSRSSGASSAALASAALATLSILVFGVICERIAGRVGGDLERAEAELQRVNEVLEQKVEERTGDLHRALRDLQRGHDALQAAHRDLKDAQARMLQQAKMASLGQTAAGVAHEINNPLAFVTNNIAVLRRDVSGVHNILKLYQQAEHTLEEYQTDLLARIKVLSEELDLPYVLGNLDGLMDRSREGLKRIQKIVADLRDFAHLDDQDESDTDLNAAVATTVSLMRGVAAAQGVTLEADPGEVPRLRCCGAKINLALQNLVSNAIDACGPGGTVTISTRRDGDGVQIAVRDNGSGIDPAIRDRIFDPFFTTKPIGQGTGLGLAMSFGIVRDHGGTIEVESAPGEGSRFAIRLPSAANRPHLGPSLAPIRRPERN